MSSSLRNAVKRKTHKERAQPIGRKKFGLLEKHKDYQLRARDYHRKQKHLDGLRRKAELRNEDEFYFGMNSTQTRNGVHVLHRGDSTDNKNDSQSQKLAQHFDKTYLQTKLQHEKHQMEKLKSSLHFIGVDLNQIDPENSPKTTIFVDDEEEAEEFKKDDNNVDEFIVKPLKSKSQMTEKAYAELLRRQKRVSALENAIQHVQLKEDLKGKGKRRKVADAEGDKPAKYVWVQERRR
jgi:U3 small nucleolar RNA-associated protein 11